MYTLNMKKIIEFLQLYASAVDDYLFSFDDDDPKRKIMKISYSLDFLRTNAIEFIFYLYLS